jgi:septation ring formation regulator EzrA
MADLNELLRQGAAEADGLAAEADRAQEVVDRLRKLSAGLAATVEAGSTEAHLRLDQLAARLNAGEGELADQNAGAVASLQGLLASAVQVRGQAGHLLERVRTDLAHVREEKEGVRATLEHEDDAARERVSRYGARVQTLEHEADEHLAEARGVTDVLRQQVEAVRATVADRREALLVELDALEHGMRQRLAEVLQAYDQAEAVVDEQIGELQATSRSLTDQVTAGLSRRLQVEALSSLEAATRPLKEAIEGLEDLAREGKAEAADRFGEVHGRIEDVTTSLERLRSPLDQVKQHLR